MHPLWMIWRKMMMEKNSLFIEGAWILRLSIHPGGQEWLELMICRGGSVHKDMDLLHAYFSYGWGWWLGTGGVLCNVVDIERGHLHRQCPRCRGYSDILSMFIYSYPTIYSFNHHQHHYASLQCANAPSVAAQWQGWNSKQILSSPFKRNLQKRII